MKVKQLTLEGFRGFSQLTLDFNPDAPTVIIGENGVGKSSVLDALAILLSWYINRVKYDPFSNALHLSGNSWGGSFSDRERDLAKGNFINDSDIRYQESKSQPSIIISHQESDYA